MVGKPALRTIIWILFFISFSLNAASQVLVGDTVQVVKFGVGEESGYSLLLPSGYTTARRYPLVIFLDPAARGDVPVNKYRQIANEQKIILAGSFASRNFDPSASVKSIASIYDDITTKFNIDTTRIWLAGFSGGARIATSFAGIYTEIKGVIACGAGFSENISTDNLIGCPFAGIVGNTDMNFEEMLGIHETLSNFRNENLLLIYEGDHQWPPPDYLSLAICWLNRTYCGDKSIQRGVAILRAAGKAIDSGLLFSSWLLAKELKKITALFLASDSLQSAIERLKSFEKNKQDFTAILSAERKWLDDFSLAFNAVIYSKEQAIEPDAWKQKARSLREMSMQKNRNTVLSGKRCQDFSWRLCIEQYSFFMSSKLYEQAYKAASILLYFEPPEFSAAFFLAKAAAGLRDEKLALKHLKESVKSGRISNERILADSLLLDFLGKEKLSSLFD